MRAALQQAAGFLRRVRRKFYEARQVTAQRTLNEHLKFHRPHDWPHRLQDS